jgi:hypothetical protein
MRLTWLFATLAGTVLLAVLHFWALADFWYWKYDFFDILMHLLGGAVVGAFSVVLLWKFRPFAYMALIILVAFSWEYFEYKVGIAVPPGVNYAWDTAHDVLNDAIGAIFVYAVARYTIWRSIV